MFRQRSPDITPVSFEVSLFGDPRIEARLPAPRGLSQVTTSFIGSWCLGIHRLPLVACLYYKDARVHCEVLNTRAVARTQPLDVTRFESALKLGRTPSNPEGKEGGDRSFRTQQRAQTDPHPRPGFPLPTLPKKRGVVLTRPAANAGSIVNVPHSRAAQPDTNGLALGALDRNPRGPATNAP